MEERDEFIERARREEFDNPGIRRTRERHPNYLAIATAIFAIVFQIGSQLYYVGRLTQRVDTIEQVQLEERQRNARLTEEQRQRDYRLADDNGKQDVTLGIIGQQYGDISRRLQNIEGKLDRR